MKRLITWLSEHRAVNIGLVIVYFIAVVLPHKVFGIFLNRVVFKGLTRDQYDLFVASGGAVLLLVLAVIFYFNTRSSSNRNSLLFYLLATGLFAVLIINTLFVINIEMVHFPQYAAFAILIFPLAKTFHSSLIWSTLAGALDESYQYFYLAPNETGYYDFNDVVTNLVGAAFGLIFLKSFGVKSKIWKGFWRRSEVWAVLGVALFIILLFMTNILSMTIADGGMFPIVKKQITEFWTKVPPNVTFHVVSPMEGLLYIFGLWAFYSKL